MAYAVRRLRASLYTEDILFEVHTRLKESLCAGPHATRSFKDRFYGTYTFQHLRAEIGVGAIGIDADETTIAIWLGSTPYRYDKNKNRAVETPPIATITVLDGEITLSISGRLKQSDMLFFTKILSIVGAD